jgi:molybdopterin molybdotransferase
MIPVAEAKKLILDNTEPLPAIKVPVPQGAGLTLARDVFAAIDIPAFTQSSMDGYAFSFEGWKNNNILTIVAEVPAGAGELVYCSPGEAARIFTGAAVPLGTDTVVMQEKVRVLNGQLFIDDSNIAAGTNVRPIGAEIRSSNLALATGTILSAAAIGFLTGIGVTSVHVYPKPSVGIIITGNELQLPGIPLSPGQVYESNSAMLTAALCEIGVSKVMVYTAADDLDALSEVLAQALPQNDLVLLTGGISVGDYDFVLRATERCGIMQLFHRVKQRPGKPLYFGRRGQQVVFGLPGNPSSVLTCFYEYVLPAVQQLCGRKGDGLRTTTARLSTTIRKNTGLTHFLKGSYDGENVTVLDAQESYRLSSFARANCLVLLPESTSEVAAGEAVEIHLLPLI